MCAGNVVVTVRVQSDSIFLHTNNINTHLTKSFMTTSISRTYTHLDSRITSVPRRSTRNLRRQKSTRRLIYACTRPRGEQKGARSFVAVPRVRARKRRDAREAISRDGCRKMSQASIEGGVRGMAVMVRIRGVVVLG